MTETVRWEELRPREFVARQNDSPVVYLPMGLCEPHGHAAAFGLDTVKAVWLCERAAERLGGIVAPTQGYQIHETGYHRPWLVEVIGAANPRLGGVPPDVLLKMYLYQLRAFANAGFRTVVTVTGHHGNQADLRLVAEEFARDRGLQTVTVSDPELVRGTFSGDHAGKYELSQLMYIRPDLVDLDRTGDITTSTLGRFAQGEDAAEASAEYGRRILQLGLDELTSRVTVARTREDTVTPATLDETEEVWQRILARRDQWCTLSEEDPDLGAEPLS